MKCVCDRCGKAIENDDGVSFEIRSLQDKTNIVEHGDLCRDCEVEFANWFTEFLDHPKPTNKVRFIECDSYHPYDDGLDHFGLDGRCWGTKETEPCTCGGNKYKCDFYKYNEKEDKLK